MWNKKWIKMLEKTSNAYCSCSGCHYHVAWTLQQSYQQKYENRKLHSEISHISLRQLPLSSGFRVFSAVHETRCCCCCFQLQRTIVENRDHSSATLTANHFMCNCKSFALLIRVKCKFMKWLIVWLQPWFFRGFSQCVLASLFLLSQN